MGTGLYVIVAVGGCHPFGGIVGPDRGLPTEDPVNPDEPFGCELTTDARPAFVGDVLPELCFTFPVDTFEFECVCGWQGFPQGVVAPALPAPKKLAARMVPTIRNARNRPDATVWNRRLTCGCRAMIGSMRRNNTSTVDRR